MAWKSKRDLKICFGAEDNENDDIPVFHHWSSLSRPIYSSQ